MEQLSFASYFMGGFECSTQRNHQGRRVDVIAATRHDELAAADYRRLQAVGLRTVRDGLRWHLIETAPGMYDFSSAALQLEAARETGTQVIWDLFHYGFPDDLDIFSAAFPDRFARFAEAFARLLKEYGATAPWLCPLNEISFFAWIAGEVGGFAPFQRGRGDELKRQLVRAALSAVQAVRTILPAARFVHTDPAIRVIPSPSPDKRHEIAARNYHLSQFAALEMMTGQLEPELGGQPEYIDVIGVNYYFNNQWRHPGGDRVLRSQRDYLPFASLLRDFYERFGRPLLIAETGIEDEARPAWLNYIAGEARQARRQGVPVLGLCLYPVVNHPGWDDDRHCHNGLWDYPDADGERGIYAPLAAELARQTELENEFSAAAGNLSKSQRAAAADTTGRRAQVGRLY